MKKIILLAAGVLGLFYGTLSSNAQTITIGTAATSNGPATYPCPYGNSFAGSKHNFLILASELRAQGMVAGNINSLSYEVSSIPTPTTLSNFQIGMKLTSASTLPSAFGTGLTTVFGPSVTAISVGWNTHNFTNAFYWDGTSNLLIETCFNNANPNGTNPAVKYSTTSFQSASTFRQSGTTTVCNATNGTLSFNRPNVQIAYSPSPIPPVASFGAANTNSCTGLINFLDSSCCLVNSWDWDFGDGSAHDFSQNPSHTYSSPGTYSVTLVVGNPYSSDTLERINFITISSGGPIAASCSTTATTPFSGFGISKVVFNSINKTSATGNSGYEDFSCTGQTNVYEGSTYTLSISNIGAQTTQNYRAWIDYNNDGIFNNNASETILSVNNASSGSAAILIPTGAVLNTPLRMRVAADSDFSPNLPSPCGNFDFGQAEDYTITIQQNTNPPVAAFSADVTNSCSGTVQFSNATSGSPTAWIWDFGDNSTSGLQNPVHTYISSGNYTVTMIAFNAFGSDTLVKSNYINVTLGVTPITALCSPSTSNYCCGYGIYKVSFGSISKTSGAASEGYQDFTCQNLTQVIEGFSNTLSIQTGTTNAQDTRVWIDYNNDGFFTNSELVLSSNNQFNPSASVTVSTGAAVLNTPLRMRVWSDYAGGTPGACNNPLRGQVEDYTVFVQPNTASPIADFTSDTQISCGGLVNFSDSSVNTVTSWSWNFGDASAVSTLQNPSHQYAAAGNYTVTLIASSPYGSDTIVKTAYIQVVSTTPGPVLAACSPITTGYCCGLGITNVTLGGISNTSNDAVDGYSDYSCLYQTTLTAGIGYPVSIKTGPIYTENVRIWIDYNNDGQLSNSEIAYSDFNHVLNHTGNIIIPATAILNTPLRMRVMSDFNNQLTSSCSNPTKGQAEDYGVVILPNNTPPVSNFSAASSLSCSGVVNFINSSTNATSYLWDFGDADTSTQLNPSHTYINSGSYTIRLIVYNSTGSDTLTLVNYINVTLGNNPIAAACSPATTSYCCGNGIYNVTLGNINNTTVDGSDGYKDYTCALRDTSLSGGLPTTISIRTGPNQAENVRVYIDYNNNGNFTTPNELVYQGNALQNHNAVINVPATGVSFYTNLRMRVMSDFSAISSSCGNVTYGQVEDYTVYIKNPLASKELRSEDVLSVFPNPSEGLYNLNYQFIGKKTLKIMVCDLLGRPVYSEETSAESNYNKTIDLSQQAKGVYLLKIVADNEQMLKKITLK